MASKAPFGTDLQPEFNVRVVAGKLIHTALTANQDKTLSITQGKARSKDSSISGTIQARRQLKEAQGHVAMDRQREGVGRPRSKRARSLDILPILEEGAVEAIEEPSPLKVANTAQKTIGKSECVLPSIVVQTPATQLSTEDHVELSVARLRAKELVAVLFKPMVNKLTVVEDVRQSCNRADHSHFGVLSKELVLNTFKSHGIKMSENDLSKLCELIPCSMGKDHVLYDKLCTTMEQILNKTYTNNLDVDSLHNTLTPLGSIESDSSNSLTDYDLGCSLSLLTDRTNLFRHSSPLEKPLKAKPKVSRSLMTHPLCNSYKKTTPKLPLIPETAGNLNDNSTSPQTKTAPVDRISAQAPWPLSTEERENGVEKMCNALRSCTDSEGEVIRVVT